MRSVPPFLSILVLACLEGLARADESSRNSVSAGMPQESPAASSTCSNGGYRCGRPTGA